MFYACFDVPKSYVGTNFLEKMPTYTEYSIHPNTRIVIFHSSEWHILIVCVWKKSKRRIKTPHSFGSFQRHELQREEKSISNKQKITFRYFTLVSKTSDAKETGIGTKCRLQMHPHGNKMK